MNDETLKHVPPGDREVSKTPAPAFQGEQDFSGTYLGSYHLVRKIAEGGMGVVYEAIQTKLDRRVALKILTEQLAVRPEFLQRFEREAKAAAALNHPNVVQVHDFGEAHGWHYLIMEFVDGQDLSSYVEERGKLTVEAALNLIEQASEALKAAHSKSIIHRDIKPSNLMFTSDGRVKVADLGLAKVLTQASDMTVSGVGMGSPYYIAPEQADNARRVDHRADIYSLGLTLFYLVTGKRAFEGDTPYSVVLAHVNKPLPSGAELGTELPTPVEELIRRMAAKDPDDRYPDYDALLADIRRVKDGLAPALPAPRRGRSNSAALKVAAVAAVVVVGVLAVVLLVRPKVAPKPEAVPTTAAPGEPNFAAHPEPSFGAPEREPFGGRRPPPPGERFGQYQERGTSRRLWPLGPPPPRPELIAEGPLETMLAAADQNALEHKGEFIRAIEGYRQLEGRVVGTPHEQEIRNKILALEREHHQASSEAIRIREEKMHKQIRANDPQAAYDVWKDFPAGLRSREVDEEIRQILEQNLPADFQPAR